MGIAYATREVVKAALDSASTARDNSRVDSAIESSSRSVEDLLHRRFYPEIATRRFDWPNFQYAAAQRFWLGANELISTTILVAGGITIPQASYFLRRADDRDEAPYSYIEMDLSTTASFSAGATYQRSTVITGLYGFRDDRSPVGTLAAAITTTTATSCTVTDSSGIGTGALLLVDTERVQVTARTMVTTGQTLQTPMTALASNTTVAVTTGSSYAVGETLLLDAERMLITDISANNLTVLRAQDGTVLATHTGSTIYAPRQLTIVRGVLGTTAATHLISAAVQVQVYPGPVVALTVAYSLNQVLQESAGYARVAGAGESQREFTGRGIADLERAALRACGRQARMGAV